MANPPLPNRGVVPFLDPDGKSVSIPWYRAFQALQGLPGSKGDPGTDGAQGPAGPPGTDDGETLATLALGLLDGSSTGVTSVASANGDLSVANPTSNVILTINSAPKWDHVRTESFTSDVTGGPTNVDGSANWSTALTLATVNASVGTYGDSTHVAQVTVNAKGLVTAVTNAAIAFPPLPTYGTGAPSTLVAEGALYFDTTLATYVGYVQHSSAWHQIA